MFDPTKPMDSQYQDPFANPFNPLTATRANWNIDPVYTTPGYTANFRPAYAGPVGYQQPLGNMGFWEGVSRGGLGGALGPDWQRMPMYMNPVQYQGAATNAAMDPMQDGMTSGAFKFAAPFAAFALGEMAMSSRVGFRSHDAATWASHMWSRAWGNNPTMTRSVSGAMGSAMGRGVTGGALNLAGNLAGGHGAALTGSAVGRGLIGLGGGAGAIAGRLALPVMAGQAIMSGVEHTFVDPYVAIRRGQKAFMANFANQYIGEDGGGLTTGFGMSRRRASQISTALTKDSVRDHAFDVGDYNIIGDYASQAGMFNDVKDFDVQTIRSRVKNIASQVKTVMAVANEPSLQEAVKMLAKLKQSGATDVGGFAGTVLSNIGSNAAVSGISVQQMMNTVGATGQYLYQSQGLTPFIGMQQAGSMHSGFSTAFRSGLIDPAAMARMGGIDGATQSAMAAQIGLARSNYNMMGLANKYMFGTENAGNWTGNIANFGSNMANDPLGTMGLMSLFDNEMVSAQLQKNPSAVYDQVFQLMNNLPGENSVGKFVSVAKGFGLSGDQLRATVEQMRAANNADARGLKTGAMMGSHQKNYLAAMAQHNLDYADSWMSVPVHGWRNMSRGLESFGTGIMGGWNEMWAGAGDWLENEALGLKYNRGDVRRLTDRDLTTGAFYKADGGARGIGIDVSKYSVPIRGNSYGAFASAAGEAGGFKEKYGSFFGAVNGSEGGQALARALKSGDKDAILRATAMLGDKINMIGGEGSRDTKVLQLLKDAKTLGGLSVDDMVYAEGRSSSTRSALKGVLGNILGKNFKGDVVSGMSMLQQAQGLFRAGQGDLLGSMMDGNGALTPEAAAFYEDAVERGMLKGVDGAGNQALALEGLVYDISRKDVAWGNQGLLGMMMPNMQGLDSKEEMLAAYRKGRKFGLSKEDRAAVNKLIKSGNLQAAAKELQARASAKGLRDSGAMLQTKPTSAIDSHDAEGKDSTKQLVQQVYTSSAGVSQEMSRMNMLREAAQNLDFTKFEMVKSMIDADLAGKYNEAADKQLRAAKINETLAEKKLETVQGGFNLFGAFSKD